MVPLKVCHLIFAVISVPGYIIGYLLSLGVRYYLGLKMSECNSWTKRQRPTSGSPAKCSKKRRDKGTFVCPVWLENIVEGTKAKPGQDAVNYKGNCDTLLHRKCAGLSKSIFNNLDKNVPYFCPHCQLHSQETEIVSLKIP